MSTRRHNATILIADDDVSVIKTLSALLETSNYDLQFASDGLQALQLARDLDPDVMLLDVMMPGMSGIDVCRKVREDPELRHIPIIVLTAFNDRSMLVRALDSGADDFMAKPVAGVELRARIRTMLRIRSQFDTLKKVMDGREELVHMAVHDLRTPLNLIAGASELLSRSAAASLSERQKYHIASIMANVQRLEDCIGQILYLAKSEHGSLVLHPQSVDVVKLLERICSEFRDRAQQQNIRVELSAPLSEFALHLDEDLVTRSVENLMNNALKYSMEGECIHVSMDFVEQPRVVTIRVTDNGPGVPPDFQELLFEKFARAEDSQRKVAGTGIGLAFCRMVANAHKGSIEYQRAEPRGSTFALRLPSVEAATAPSGI